MVYEQFGNLLNKYLQQGERSEAWLAGRLKVAPVTVNRWVNGENRPNSPELVTRIADVLGPYGAKRQDLLIAAGYAVKESDEYNMQSAPPKVPSRSDASTPHQPTPGPESGAAKSNVGILVQGDLVNPRTVISHTGTGDINFVESELQALKRQLTSEHSDAATRAKAAKELGELYDDRAVSTMSDRLIEDTDPTVRYWLAYALGQIGGPAAIEALEEAAKEIVDPEIRYWLACALGQIGSPAAIEALEEAAKQEKHMRARQGIIDGLKKAGRLTNLPSLIAD